MNKKEAVSLVVGAMSVAQDGIKIVSRGKDIPYYAGAVSGIAVELIHLASGDAQLYDQLLKEGNSIEGDRR